jgi:transposase
MTTNVLYRDEKLPSRLGVSYHVERNRLRSAREYAAAGKSLMEVSKLWGVSYVAAYKFLRKRDEALAREIMQNRGPGNPIPASEHTRRVHAVYRAIKEGRTKADVARELGITPQALQLWLKRVCSDGIEQAYQDYSEEKEFA